MNIKINQKKFNFLIKTYKIYGIEKKFITPVYLKRGLNKKLAQKTKKITYG